MSRGQQGRQQRLNYLTEKIWVSHQRFKLTKWSQAVSLAVQQKVVLGCLEPGTRSWFRAGPKADQGPCALETGKKGTDAEWHKGAGDGNFPDSSSG
jgi:hypothetical protein